MSKYIATKLHLALEVDPEESVLLEMHQGAHFVIDQTLIELLSRSDVIGCIRAMLEAEIAHLPVESLTLEFEFDGVRRFVLLKETSQGMVAHVASMTKQALEVTFRQIHVRVDKIGVFVDNHCSEMDGWCSGFAAQIALLMLHTRGIEKEVIEPTKLNAKRQATGKIRIPKHTVVRIGSVYDREGRAHSVGNGRHLPLHLRIGHARHQAHGPKHSERKWIFIPPVIVSYRPDEEAGEVKMPKKILAR